jgi:hypothetical protein
VSLSVVQWSKSAGEQGVLCTVITRMFIDHDCTHGYLLYHTDLYSCFLLFRSIIYKVARFASDKTASGNLCLTYGNFCHGYIKSPLFSYLL